MAVKKQRTTVSSKKPKTGKIKKPKNKSSTRSANVSKLIKPAGKKLTPRAKTAKRKISPELSTNTKRQIKPKKRIVAAKKPSKKRPLTKPKPSKRIEVDDERLLFLRKTLRAKRESILKEAKEEIARYISGENRQFVDATLEDGDWAEIDASEDLNLMRLTTHRRTLLEIDEALRKISEGTYGICEDCGDQISEKRLSILPSATLCINCQEDKEKLEAIEKEDLR